MTARLFHIGDILSVTTGRLVSPRHMDGVHELLDFMTGDQLFTHQLPRASGECEPHLRAQHPDLAAIPAPDFTGLESRDALKAAVDFWLSAQVALYGELRPVVPLPSADHTRINPLTELAMNWPDVQVIVINPKGDR